MFVLSSAKSLSISLMMMVTHDQMRVMSLVIAVSNH